MPRLESLGIKCILDMTFMEALEHIKEVRFRRRTVATKKKVESILKEKGPKAKKDNSPLGIFMSLSPEEQQEFLKKLQGGL